MERDFVFFIGLSFFEPNETVGEILQVGRNVRAVLEVATATGAEQLSVFGQSLRGHFANGSALFAGNTDDGQFGKRDSQNAFRQKTLLDHE